LEWSRIVKHSPISIAFVGLVSVFGPARADDDRDIGHYDNEPGYSAPREYSRGYRGYTASSYRVPTPIYGPIGHADYLPEAYDRPLYGEPPPGYGLDGLRGYPEAYPPPVGPPSLVIEADVLIEQSAAFIQVFSRTGARVPEAGRQLAEAQALNESARYFRQLLSADAHPGRLANAFREIERSWGRMSRRTERLAEGRTGPNIEQVRLMGRTIERIRREFPY
jgi:hypothetical protein